VTTRKCCRNCRRWFEAHPRAGPRQAYCERQACRAASHRAASQKWRRKNPTYDSDRRFRKRLRGKVEGVPPGVAGAAGRDVDWQAARDVVPAKIVVLVREVAKVVELRARDSVAPKVQEQGGKSRKVPPVRARDDLASARAGP
jgi:hypothetical protein